MSFKFEFKIDYEKLTTLLDIFLKSHTDELTSIMGRCLVLQQAVSNNPPPPQPEPKTEQSVVHAPPDLKIDNKPLIGDTIPEDPLSNLFNNSSPNPNADTTRYKDRNNPNIKKGYKNW